MRQLCTPLFAFFVAVLWAGTSYAQITTVLLSEDKSPDFSISSGTEKTSKTLEFKLAEDATLSPDAVITDCALRVVAKPQPSEARPQDVLIFAGNEKIGQWSAFAKRSPEYRVELNTQFCAPKPTVQLKLESESSDTGWKYYGGDAPRISDRPRLILTYNSKSRPKPARSGQATDWKYFKPENATFSFFKSPLGNLRGTTLLTNPVSYNGAVFVIASSSNSTSLYRLANPGKTDEWPLKMTPNVQTTAESFAFVTTWGSLKVITENALYSCNLSSLPSPGTPAECPSTPVTISVNDDTPAMGADGSLYFKNVTAGNNIVAFNPSREEIWRAEIARADFKATKAGPIALSADGRYAYLLAEIDSKTGKRRSLLRIDTATGETVEKEIVDEKGVKPLLVTLLRPTVVRKEINGRNVDYVFIAGNAEDTGILQLVLSDPSAKAVSPLWTLTLKGKVATQPVLNVKDGNSLFVLQEDGKLLQYDWFGADGPYGRDKLQPVPVVAIGEGTIVLVDGSDSVYRPPSGYRGVQFTSDGAIIGYKDNAVYDISPNSGQLLSSQKLSSRTIYSGQTVTVSPDAANGLAKDAEVILKGNNIKLTKGFHWPLGATLKLQSVQQ